MKILILGAAGGVGSLLVEQALDRGHAVTAFVRNAATVQQREGLSLAEGDVLDERALARAVPEHDAVVMTIGVNSTGPTTLFSESTRKLIPVMAREGVRRLVCITGIGAGETKGHGGFFYDRIIYPLFTKHRYKDKELQEELVRRSGLDWTIVRPAPFTTSEPKSNFQVTTDVGTTVLRKIKRRKVAEFILEELETNRFVRQTPFIGHAR